MANRVYLSGPITGVSDYRERFDEAEKQLSVEGYSVVNPAKVCSMLPDDFGHEEYLHVCFAMLDLCGTVLMLDGWEQSSGARQELAYSVSKGKSVENMKEYRGGENGKKQ